MEEILGDATKFQTNLQEFMDWLSEAERTMKTAKKTPISVMPDKVSDLISQHAVSAASYNRVNLALFRHTYGFYRMYPTTHS